MLHACSADTFTRYLYKPIPFTVFSRNNTEFTLGSVELLSSLRRSFQKGCVLCLTIEAIITLPGSSHQGLHCWIMIAQALWEHSNSTHMVSPPKKRTAICWIKHFRKKGSCWEMLHSKHRYRAGEWTLFSVFESTAKLSSRTFLCYHIRVVFSLHLSTYHT